MNLTSKKYFSISEAAKIIGVPAHKLRYLEKTASTLDVFQVRGRRYYTISDINSIKEKFNLNNNIQSERLESTTQLNNKEEHQPANLDIVTKIDSLILKLTKLEKTLGLGENK